MLIPLDFDIEIQQPIETVFGYIANLSTYAQWLPSSDVYTGIQAISDTSPKLGTTYIDKGRFFVFKGEIIAYEAPTSVTFFQTAHRRFLFLSLRLEGKHTYRLSTTPDGTHVKRISETTVLGIPNFLGKNFKNALRQEMRRILDALKTYCEKNA